MFFRTIKLHDSILSKYRLALCFFLCGSGSVFAQEFLVDTKQYGVEDGPASKIVNCGVPDDDGFIWLGTRFGLQRFDGHKFKLYTKEKDGLAGNNVVQLELNKQGNLWVFYNTVALTGILPDTFEIMKAETGEIMGYRELTAQPCPFDLAGTISIHAGDTGDIIFTEWTFGQNPKNEVFRYAGQGKLDPIFEFTENGENIFNPDANAIISAGQKDFAIYNEQRLLYAIHSGYDGTGSSSVLKPKKERIRIVS
jgi:hypothetical protein